MYLIKTIKKKAHTGKEIIKITFGVIAAIIITLNTAGFLITTKDLSLTVVLYVKAIKLKNSLQGG